MLEPRPQRTGRRRPRRRSSWPGPFLPIALGLGAAVFLLLLGISIGRALEDGPRPGGTRTDVRTVEPEQLPPVARTVTVTVSG